MAELWKFSEAVKYDSIIVTYQKKKILNDSNIVTVTKPKGRMHLKGKCSMLKMKQEW